MLNDLDILNAWQYWYKLGLTPPIVKDKNEFKQLVKEMLQHFRKVAPEIFAEAIVIVGRDKKGSWPTFYDLQQAIERQERCR